MLQMLKEAGLFGYMVVIVGVLSAGFSVWTWAVARKEASPRRRLVLGVAWVLGALLIFGLGVIGYLVGMKAVGQALAAASPDVRDALLAQGRSEASQNIVLGAIFCAVPALSGLLLLMSGRKKGPQTPA
ncbi:MAG TPA: hypothetical protein PK668_03035 [Myxococcota bacterium]|nr:hypothetical protein [Myxococcota bacterium]HRY91829.1 hypothetical protein [Myxococcota bacterium]HSA23838.1 hypothetical protein [Myxococcota bacterium]